MKFPLLSQCLVQWLCIDRSSPDHTGVCNAPIYPDDFDESSVVCDVIIRKWSFNATRGQCVEINYLPCGPDSQGYNVFEDLQTCARTCIRPRNTSKADLLLGAN